MKNGDLIQEARQSEAVDWIAAACISCVLYDYALTFGDEVQKIWSARLSLPKVLFFLNRYLVGGMLVFNAIASARNHLDVPFCKFYLRWLVCTITVTNIVVQGILVARVWAIYRRNKLVLGIAISFYLGGVLTLIGLTLMDYIGETVTAVGDQFLPGCYAASVPPIIAGYWIAPVIIESVLFCIVVSRAFVWWKDRERAPPTLVLLARDSTAYFTVVFALLFANLFVFEYGPPFLSSMMVTPSNAVGCIAGSHMILNLRGISHTNVSEMELSKFTALQFAPGSKSRSPKGRFDVVTGLTVGDMGDILEYDEDAQDEECDENRRGVGRVRHLNI